MSGRVVTLAKVRRGDGFTRQFVTMGVYRTGDGAVVAHHRDTRVGKDQAQRFASVEDVSGYFGFCPAAISVYQTLGVPVRRAA